jgi:hypothetical protein
MRIVKEKPRTAVPPEGPFCIDCVALCGQVLGPASESSCRPRMSDVIAMQPNLNIPLYLVAPAERRGKVLVEVNRPMFSRLSPPLAEVCLYIAFAALRARLSQVAPFVRYLEPDFLDDLSESCEIEEA